MIARRSAEQPAWRRILWAAVALLCAGGLFIAGRMTAFPRGGTPSQPGQTSGPPGLVRICEEAQRNIGLRVVRAAVGPVVAQLHAAAIVAADETRTATLRPAGNGRILAMMVRAGDAVRRGQVLLTYDDLSLDALEMQMISARAELAQAQAARQAAGAALRRGLALAGGAVAASEIDRRRAALAQSDATLASARGRIADLDQQMRQHTRLPGHTGVSVIAAPSDGTVTEIDAAPGMLVDPSEIVARTMDLSNVSILASVYQNDVHLVRAGGMAVITVPGLAGRRIEAPVRTIGQSLDPRSGAVLVRCDVPNPDGSLRPGMVADAELETTQSRTALTVPEAAVQRIDGNPVVFVRTDRDRFQRHQVELGLETDTAAEVKSGLSAGDAVVTIGSFALKSKLLQAQIAAGS